MLERATQRKYRAGPSTSRIRARLGRKFPLTSTVSRLVRYARPMSAAITVSLTGHVGTGLILEHPSGITYLNQAGGTYCLQLTCEGIFLPWFNDVELGTNLLLSRQDALYGVGWEMAGYGMSTAQADAVDGILRGTASFQGIRVDRARLAESCEAWVRVVIEPPHQLGGELYGIDPFPARGVLVWTNSD
jgi:hypothetical protein